MGVCWRGKGIIIINHLCIHFCLTSPLISLKCHLFKRVIIRSRNRLYIKTKKNSMMPTLSHDQCHTLYNKLHPPHPLGRHNWRSRGVPVAQRPRLDDQDPSPTVDPARPRPSGLLRWRTWCSPFWGSWALTRCRSWPVYVREREWLALLKEMWWIGGGSVSSLVLHNNYVHYIAHSTD